MNMENNGLNFQISLYSFVKLFATHLPYILSQDEHPHQKLTDMFYKNRINELLYHCQTIKGLSSSTVPGSVSLVYYTKINRDKSVYTCQVVIGL